MIYKEMIYLCDLVYPVQPKTRTNLHELTCNIIPVHIQEVT